ncbi:MAG TPA: DUF6159 family protein [Verrucomicrobiae bacterium]|jgi:hypothetical protein|nr:DUF6159 family protein [Verrucomicrobiae bacterium]
MNKKFTVSWQLFRASATIVFRHPKLLCFPLVITLLTSVIALVFISAMALPMVLHDTGYHITQKQHWEALENLYFPKPVVVPKYQPPTSLRNALSRIITGHPTSTAGPGNSMAPHPSFWNSVWVLPLYLGSMFLATFFNVAFYSEIITALNGKGVSLRRGFGVARGRLRAILAWSLLAGVVGWIIRSIEERLPFAGRIMMGLVGMAWSVAAVFAIPVIIQEQSMHNPVKILQQSATTLKRTWGEGLIGYIGFSAANAVIFMVSLVPLLAVGAFAWIFKSWWTFGIGGVLWLFSLMCMAYVVSVAGHVFRCALYLFAAEGTVPDPYDKNLLDAAWRVKGLS